MDATDDVVEVIHAAFQVGVFHSIEDLGELVTLHAQCVAGAVALVADQLVQPEQQLRVIQQQGVQVEEFADIVGQGALQALAQIMHFRARGLHRLVQALQFGIHFCSRYAFFSDLQRMWQADAGAAQRTTARCPVTGEARHHQRYPRVGATR